MTDVEPNIIELQEYVPRVIAPEEAPSGLGELLWSKYGPKNGSKINVDFPSPKTGGQLQVTSQGWVGYIPINSTLALRLKPKTEITNLFRMLEYGYELRGFEILEGIVECKTLDEFYQNLAKILASRVLARARKGFYRSYISENEELPYIRGRMDISEIVRAPWKVGLSCSFEDHTADIEDNQLIAWTLGRIARNKLCTERVLPTVRKAYRSLLGVASPAPCTAESCLQRTYNRLNEDYHSLHLLCRFFLENTGPSHEPGDQETLPFLVDMASLFELFVAKWLKSHPIQGMQTRAQERLLLGEKEELEFRIDLLLVDAAARVVAVIDTKYKAPDSPSADDVSQVVAYAEAKGCHEAILVYPVNLKRPLDIWIGKIRVRTVAFRLDGDLEANGAEFLTNLLPDELQSRSI
jgi:5-methylcytosine-specific restriction enzyme subunit McrC